MVVYGLTTCSTAILCPPRLWSALSSLEHHTLCSVDPRTTPCQALHTLPLLSNLELERLLIFLLVPSTWDLSWAVLPGGRPWDRCPCARALLRKWSQEKAVKGWRGRMGKEKKSSRDDIWGKDSSSAWSRQGTLFPRKARELSFHPPVAIIHWLRASLTLLAPIACTW